MNADVLPILLSALNLAAFERHPDGAFTAVAAPPEWFRHLSKGMTFPFLGGFLDEARDFWARAKTGRVSSGLCAETDATGREFHFEVSALAAGSRQFLVFALEHDAEQMRGMLQKAREQALDSEAGRKREADTLRRLAVLAAAGEEAQGAARLVVELTATLGNTALSDRQREILLDLRGAGERVLARADALVETAHTIAETANRD